MVQYAGKKMLRWFRQIHWLAGSMGRRPASPVNKAHMNVHAIADEVGVGLGRKDDPMSEPVCCSARAISRVITA